MNALEGIGTFLTVASIAAAFICVSFVALAWKHNIDSNREAKKKKPKL